jgi:hypothetical protein
VVDKLNFLNSNVSYLTKDFTMPKPNAVSTLQAELDQWLSVNMPAITGFHVTIAELWKTSAKDRNLATVESAVRGIGSDMERLSLAIPKMGTDKVSDVANGSKFAKPR